MKNSKRPADIRNILTRERDSERLVFDLFRQKLGLAGEFGHNKGNERGDERKPDFTGYHEGKTLGIEITEINIPGKIDGRSLPELEVAKQRIVDRARDEAIKCGLPAVRVRVTFRRAIPKGKEAFLTETLFQMVSCHRPPLDHAVELDGKNGLPNEFLRLGIRNCGKKHDWAYIEAGVVQSEFSSRVQEIIDTKSDKIAQYLQHCRACWLIIAALGDRPSSFYEIGDQVRTTRYKSGFERVFFLNWAFGTVEELHVAKG
jgi:hypothetical protein